MVEVLLTLQPCSSRLSQGVTQWLKKAVLYPPQVIPYGMHMDYMEWVVESMERVMESMD